MLLIIAFHSIYKGGFEFNQSGFFLNRLICDFIYYWGEVGVNCFILISGFFIIETKFSLEKLLSMGLKIDIYLLLCNIILSLYDSKYAVYPWNYKQYLFPILKNSYWFVTVYVLIYILTPYLKTFVLNIKDKSLRKMLEIQIFLWSIFPTLRVLWLNDYNTEDMPYYNRYIWCLIIYLLGAYIKLYGIPIINSLKKSLISLMTLITLLLLFIIFAELYLRPNVSITAVSFWRPNSLIVFLISISLFNVFLYLEVDTNIILNYVASCTLGIYMFHDGPLANILWSDLFCNVKYQYSKQLVIRIMLSTITVLGVGVIVESIVRKIENFVMYICIKIYSTLRGKIYSIRE